LTVLLDALGDLEDDKEVEDASNGTKP